MVTIIATMVDNNAFRFNKCNFGIRSGFKKKIQFFFNSVKGNTFSKFEFIILRAEKAFCMTSIPRYRKVSQVRWAIKNNLCSSYYIHICKIYERYS